MAGHKGQFSFVTSSIMSGFSSRTDLKSSGLQKSGSCSCYASTLIRISSKKHLKIPCVLDHQLPSKPGSPCHKRYCSCLVCCSYQSIPFPRGYLSIALALYQEQHSFLGSYQVSRGVAAGAPYNKVSKAFIVLLYPQLKVVPMPVVPVHSIY